MESPHQQKYHTRVSKNAGYNIKEKRNRRRILQGHKNLKTTLPYAQFVALSQNEEYICKVAKSVEGAKDLIEAGFEYATDLNDCKLFRKMKTSYLRS